MGAPSVIITVVVKVLAVWGFLFVFVKIKPKRTGATKEAGYVYILTNPSFKEDWVKIGKCSVSVEQRVRQLDTTAIPLPFEIYATMKTSKFHEAEKLIHDFISTFTNLRIRDKREFFNIQPEKAASIYLAPTIQSCLIILKPIFSDRAAVEIVRRPCRNGI